MKVPYEKGVARSPLGLGGLALGTAGVFSKRRQRDRRGWVFARKDAIRTADVRCNARKAA